MDVQHLEAFNLLNINFLDFVEECFPNNFHIKIMNSAIRALIISAPEVNVKTWKACTFSKYRYEILQRDLDIFTSSKYKEQTEEIGLSKLIIDILSVLRKPIEELSSEKKEKISDYLIKLLKLCDKL